jgi:hypothetical protein
MLEANIEHVREAYPNKVKQRIITDWQIMLL